ncbi:MAG: zinc ribbon domain-containing protein [Mycobacterium sp.]
MSTGPDEAVRECPACRECVPVAQFCGHCGADQLAGVTARRTLLRPRVFVAAHRQSVFLPLITSTLCPHLSKADRTPFRHGLLIAAAALVAVSLLGQIAPMVVLTCLGIPLLFLLYLWRSDIYRDIPAWALALASVIGIALSVAWWLWTGARVAGAYGIPLSAGFQLLDVLNLGLAVAAGDAALMMVPAVVVRLLRPRTVESLDGFVIGALGSLAYTTAGTITWLAPQHVAGLLDNYDPLRLLSRALLYGLFDPLTAAAAGGAMGILLWYRPGQRAGVRWRLALCTLIGAACYLALYAVDAANVRPGTEDVINLAITLLAWLALRIAMQIAVLHELHDEASGRPVRCIHCSATVPDMPFCPQCGAAERASSRSARRVRGEAAGSA